MNELDGQSTFFGIKIITEHTWFVLYTVSGHNSERRLYLNKIYFLFFCFSFLRFSNLHLFSGDSIYFFKPIKINREWFFFLSTQKRNSLSLSPKILRLHLQDNSNESTNFFCFLLLLPIRRGKRQKKWNWKTSKQKKKKTRKRNSKENRNKKQ